MSLELCGLLLMPFSCMLCCLSPSSEEARGLSGQGKWFQDSFQTGGHTHLSFSVKVNSVALEIIVFIFKLIVLPPKDDGVSGQFGAGSVSLWFKS